MKQLLKRLIPQAFNRNNHNKKINDKESELIYIHIGKCGGSSLWQAINESKLVKKQFSHVHKIHMGKPPVLNHARYLIVIRNPISRAISAFNWRYKLVVEDEVQRNRFAGEWEILNKYQTLNQMAESLYTNGKVNDEVAKEFETIHHLREDIEFYLCELLKNIQAEQLFGVLATETLGEDVERQLAVATMKRTYENGKYVDKNKKYLSEQAYNNLKQYLSGDYDCLKQLVQLKSLTVCDKGRLLR